MANLTKLIGKPLTPPKSFFKWCERQIPTYQWSNKQQTIKASERTDCRIIKKRLTKKSCLTFGDKFYPFAIILVSKNRIEIQSYGYWHEVKDGQEIITSRLTNFERFSNGQHIKANHWDNNFYKGLLSNYGFMSGAYTNTVFYPNDWQDKLKRNRDMTYVDLPRIQRQDISRIYKYRHEIEYLQKIGNPSLARQIMFTGKLSYGNEYYSVVNMAIMTKSWLRKHKSLIRKSDKSFNDLMLEIYLQQKGLKMIDGIGSLIHYKQLKQLPKDINLNKFLNYLKKEQFSFSYYMDYIHMLQELETPLDSDLVVFPKDLTKSHDDLVQVINQLKTELEEKEYAKRQQLLKKYEQEIDEFVFLVHKELQEIVQEGSALHHCVGSHYYVDRHKKGDTNILFIRKKDNINEPFFTMEYQQQKVVQIQGKYNREHIPKNVTQAVKKWEKQIKKIS